MNKPNVLTQSIDYELLNYHVIPASNVETFTFAQTTGTGDMEELLNTPMCYLKKDGRNYDLYISVAVLNSQTIGIPTIEQTGSTYFLTLPLVNTVLAEGIRILYLKFEDIPKPVGFKVPSISVKVMPLLTNGGVGNGGVGNEEGSKSTTVDYEDADEEVVVTEDRRGTRRRR